MHFPRPVHSGCYQIPPQPIATDRRLRRRRSGFAHHLVALLVVAGGVLSLQAQQPLPAGSVDPTFAAASAQIVVFPPVETQELKTGDTGIAADGSVFLSNGLTKVSDRVGPYHLYPVVTKLKAGGDVDADYGTNGTVTLGKLTGMTDARPSFAMAVEVPGTVLVATSHSDSVVVRRLTLDGQVDTTFGTSGEAVIAMPFYPTVHQVLLAHGSKIVIACTFNYPNGLGGYSGSLCLVSLKNDGSRDPAFGQNGVSVANDPTILHDVRVMQRDDGRIRTCAWITTSARSHSGYTVGPGLRLQQFDLDGAPDATFGTEGGGIIYSGLLPVHKVMGMSMDATGAVLIVGPRGPSGCSVLRMTPAGVPDVRFGGGHGFVAPLFNYIGVPVLTGYHVVQRSDGRIYVSGMAQVADSADFDGFLLRLKIDGSVDTEFGNGGLVVHHLPSQNSAMHKVVFQPDGRPLVQVSSRIAGGVESAPNAGGVVRFTGGLFANDPPVILSILRNPAGPVPYGARFTATAQTLINALPLEYCWRKGDSVISREATLTIDPATLDSVGAYTLEVKNNAGSAMESFTLAVDEAPFITRQPVVGYVGETAVFTVETLGVKPFSYQWQRFGSDCDGPHVSELNKDTLIVPRSHGYKGDYRVVITNAKGSVTSAVVSFNPPYDYPVVTTHPSSEKLLAVAGHSFQLLTVVSGRAGLAFQWQKDGVNLGNPSPGFAGPGSPDLTYDVLTLPLDVASTGSYRCIITNAFGSATTDAATFSVYAGPQAFMTVPRAIMRTGDALGLSVMPLVGEGVTPQFQWLRNGRKIPGAAELGYGRDPTTWADAGEYQVVMTHGSGKVTSDTATVAVVQSEDQRCVFKLGTTATLSMKTAGPGLYLTWRRIDGQPLDAARCTGIHTPTLKIASLLATDAGSYVCDVVWSAYHAPAVSSGAVALVIATQPPEIISTVLPPSEVLSPYHFELAALHAPSTFSATGLPRGLKLEPATGVISGAPSVAGTFQVKISASNPVGTSPVVTLPLTIAPLPATVAGSFAGPVGGEGHDAVGFMQVTVSTNGAYSGKVSFNAKTDLLKVLNFKGQLQAAEDAGLLGHAASFTLTYREPEPENAILVGKCQLYLQFLSQNGQWQAPKGLLTSDTDRVEAGLHRRAFTSKFPATAHAGYNTLVLAHSSNPGALGYGYGTLRVQASGDVTFAGRLPGDGAFTASSFLMDNPESDHADTYVHAWTANPRHSISGWLHGMSALPSGYVFGELYWRHLPSMETEVPGNLLNGWVRAAFNVTGSLYLRPREAGLTSDYMMNIPAPGNAMAVISHDPAKDAWMPHGVLSKSHVLTFEPQVAGDPFKMGKLIFNADTGTFTGQGTYYIRYTGTTAAATFYGAVVRTNPNVGTQPEATNGTGFGFFSYPTKAVLQDPDTSRSVTVPLVTSGTIVVGAEGALP